METNQNKRTHNTGISLSVILGIEDDLDDYLIPQSSYYKEFCKYIPQDLLDNFLSWYGQECIERYTQKLRQEPIDEEKLEKESHDVVHGLSTHIKLGLSIPDYDNKREIYKAGYRKRKGE